MALVLERNQKQNKEITTGTNTPRTSPARTQGHANPGNHQFVLLGTQLCAY